MQKQVNNNKSGQDNFRVINAMKALKQRGMGETDGTSLRMEFEL